MYVSDGDSSPDLLKVILDIIEKKKCEKVWKSTYKSGLPDSILCAGYDESGKDTCSVSIWKKYTKS